MTTSAPSPAIPKITPLAERSAWKALIAHHDKVKSTTLKDLFAKDPRRGERLTAEFGGIFLAYSKNRVTAETMRLLREINERLTPGLGRRNARWS